MSGDSVSSGSSDISDIYLPNKSVAAQDLVGGSYTLAGFLRKRAPINTFPGTKKIFPWGQRFVVLHRGCLYCYKNETDRKPCSSFSLFGYNKVFRAGEVLPSEAPWAFKLCHAYPTFKTYYFSAASEDNMKTWMKQMKLEMIRANKQSVNRTSADGRSDGCDDSMSYRAIEEAIYDANEFRPVSKAPQAPLEDDDSEDDYNDVTNLTMPELPEKPIVPKRPLPRPSPALGAISNELQNLQIGKKTDETRGKKRLPGDGRETTPFHREPRDGGFQWCGLQSPTMPPDEAPLPPKKPQKPRKASVTEENYWSLIYFQETRGNTASELIRRLGEEGVFLVRDSQSGSSKVLVVFAEGMPKKYKINYQSGRYSLTQEHSFESIEELIYFYHTSALPCNVCLTLPFFKHPDYNP